MTVEGEFPAARAIPQNQTAVDFEHSGNLAEFLNQLGISLLVSTYQAGKVLSVGCHSEKVQVRFHDFEQAMGLARTPTGLAIGTRRQIWFLPAAPDLAARVTEEWRQRNNTRGRIRFLSFHSFALRIGEALGVSAPPNKAADAAISRLASNLRNFHEIAQILRNALRLRRQSTCMPSAAAPLTY